MPRVYSVSEIKVMLSGILSSHAELKNIKVRGKISPLRNTYFLSDGGIGIGCFIPPSIRTRYAQLLVPGTSVIVKGNITLHTDPGFNEYKIDVSNITFDTDGVEAFSMSQVKRLLLKIIENQFEFIDIRARGIINHVSGLPGNVLSLNDSDGSAILCQLHNNTLPNQHREEVFVRGKICNFSTRNKIQYRIDVAETEPYTPDDSIAQCQCEGCDSCQPQEGMCPPLQDPEYKLCARCYHESPDREDRVAQAVYAYFNALGGNGFSPKKEQQIQIGFDNRRADVVLVKDGTETFAAIAECKGAEYEGNGRAQLNGYLSASNTDFGIFANRVDPSRWEFYKEQGQNQYNPITPDQFKKEIRALTDPVLQSARNRIDTLESENEQLRQIQQRLREQLGDVKALLRSAMQGVDRANEEIDE